MPNVTIDYNNFTGNLNNLVFDIFSNSKNPLPVSYECG